MEADKKNSADQHDIIYALRTAQQHHVQLGLMADQKANIVLGSYLIFITVTQGLLEKNVGLTIPIWTLTSFYTISALFALMVITPRFRDRKIAPGQKPTNLLFFGSFSKLNIEDYVSELSAKLQTNESAREMMMRDIYFIGLVLQKKYSNLRTSYAMLGAGFAVTFLVFVYVQLR